MSIGLLAQALAGLSIAGWAVWIVAVIAICALVALFLRYSGISIPPIVVSAVWIVLGAIVVILAIILLSRFAGMA